MTARLLSVAAMVIVTLAPIVPRALTAQTGVSHATLGKLGTVHFRTSCAPAVGARFDHGIALLHSFEFGASIRTFNEVLAADSTCAMAWWGIALSSWTNPMTPSLRPPDLLARGRQAVEAAQRVGGRATDRERGYIGAVSELYKNFESRDQTARVVAYEKAMAELVAKFPADTEARIFHAIALVASAPPTDKTYANQLEAGATLESLFVKQPNHPGLAHYIIHGYDVPALAGRAARAAQRYADIAPEAAHALHMPSHTFTRVGMWNQSVRTNYRSMQQAKRGGSWAELLHAADYAVYANLQMRRDSAVRAILQTLPTIAERFDPKAVTGAAPGSAGVFALAAIPARYAMERRAWSEATALQPKPSDFPYTEALTYFARSLGASHLGKGADARIAIDSLDAIRARLAASGESYWAEQVAIQRIAAQAWLDFSSGGPDTALAEMREAARREDATEKAAVTPGPLAPSRELLADMLVELKRPADALAEYRAALAREPKRYRSLYGAQQAATASGNRAAAAQYSREIAALIRR
jgi:hypothetical protein